ncbi:MAG: hypothetical protein ACI87E_005057 [Mariniblastus sp.]|jgi:hypothetical protein
MRQDATGFARMRSCLILFNKLLMQSLGAIRRITVVAGVARLRENICESRTVASPAASKSDIY